jgi:hypothetical protein
VYKPALKHELDPPARGLLEPTFSGGRNYSFKRGIVECPSISRKAHNAISLYSKYFSGLLTRWKKAVSVDIPAL